MSGLEAITYTACLLHRKTPEEVLKVIEERFELSDAYTQCNSAGVMALIPEMHRQAQELCEEQVRRPGSYDLRNVFLQLLYLLGRADDAQRLSQDLLDTSVYPFRYQKEVMQHVSGEIETGVFIENAGKSRINQTAAFFQVAMNELAKGNRNEARAYFGRCVDIGLFVDGNYWWAKRYLAFMDESANWPEWIPRRAQ